MTADELDAKLGRAVEAMRGLYIATVAGHADSTDVVRALAQRHGAELTVGVSGTDFRRVLVSADWHADGVHVWVHGLEWAKSECEYCGEPCTAEHRWCRDCQAKGECVRCEDPRVEALGYVPREGYCGYCQDDDGDKARMRARNQRDAEAAR